MLESKDTLVPTTDGPRLCVLVLPVDPKRAADAVAHLAELDRRGKVVRFVRRNRTNLLRALRAWSDAKGAVADEQRLLIRRVLVAKEADAFTKRLMA